jgi:hypothetical protein
MFIATDAQDLALRQECHVIGEIDIYSRCTSHSWPSGKGVCLACYKH